VDIAYSPAEWAAFFAAVAGASATLCGLVFVGVALNLERIRQSPALVGRAGQAIAILLGGVVVSLVCLIPKSSAAATGGLVLAAGLSLWCLVTRLQVSAYQEHKATFLFYYTIRVTISQLAMIPIAVAGVSLMAGAGGGLRWLAFGTVASLVVGVFDAWVLAIEIVR
jgi:hypothetical protein